MQTFTHPQHTYIQTQTHNNYKNSPMLGEHIVLNASI